MRLSLSRFAWSRNTSVHFVDEYDRLDSSLQLFRGLSPANLREQLRKRKEEFPDPGNRVFEVEVKDGECGGRGRDKWPKVGGARSGEEVCYVSTVELGPSCVYKLVQLTHEIVVVM